MNSILVVEDHVIFAQILTRVLHEKGHLKVAAVVSSAEEALEKIPGLEVDLILVDVSLPHRSGISLVVSLHADYPDIPCVMLSGHLSSHYARRSLDAGARGYLIKDHADEIVHGIRRVLDGEIYVSEEINWGE
jgi:DNA-binding NarL/FixJ family response regulator